MATFNKVLVKAILQEYVRAAENIKREALVAAYQGLENRYILIYYAVEARRVVDKA